MENKLVSVVITTYKGEDSICRAVQSVLNQTYKNYEIIIVDDNGVNSIHQIKTEKLINKFKAKNIMYICHDKNRNGAVARNTAIDKCKGEYITFLDDDDVMLPERINNSVYYLETNSEFDAVFVGTIYRKKNRITGNIIPEIKESIQIDLLRNSSMFGTGSNIFIRSKSIIDLKGFNDNYIRHQDLEMLLRFFEIYKGGVLKEYLIVKGTNSTNNIPRYESLKLSKKIYHNDFKNVINKLSEEEKKKYYTKEKESLLNSCYGCENKKNIYDAKRNLLRYRKLKLSEKLFCLLSYCKLGHINMYLIVKKLYVNIKDIYIDKKIRNKLNTKLCIDIDKLFNL